MTGVAFWYPAVVALPAQRFAPALAAIAFLLGTPGLAQEPEQPRAKYPHAPSAFDDGRGDATGGALLDGG